MTPRLRAVRSLTLPRVVALIAALIVGPLILARPAAAAGTFVPSGTSVQIAFTESVSSSANLWVFIFTGANPQSGSCPNGGTLSTDYNGNLNQAACSFPAASVAGTVDITLDVAYSCTSVIQDEVGSVANLQSDTAITCSSEQTTTTTPTGTTTTSTSTTTSTTTTTTEPATTTTTPTPTTTAVTTTTQGRCQCESLTVALFPSGISVAHLSSSGGASTRTQLALTIHWALHCTTGVGSCSGKVTVHGPAGGTTTLYRSKPTSGGAGSKQAHRLRPLVITCAGPCGATTRGVFYVQWTTTGSLRSRSVNFGFDTNCNGTPKTQTMTLVFSGTGAFLAGSSKLGAGGGH